MTTPEIIVCNAFISVIVGLIVFTIFSCMIIKTKETMEDKLLEIKKTISDKDWDTFKKIYDIRQDFITFKCDIRKEMREMQTKNSQINKNTAVSYDYTLADVFFEVRRNKGCVDYVIGVRLPNGLNPSCCYEHTLLSSEWNREEEENTPEPEIISNDGSIVVFKHLGAIYKYIVQENVCYLA